MLHQLEPIAIPCAAALLFFSLPSTATGRELTVRAENRTDMSRPDQTIEISSQELSPLGEGNLNAIHVTDASGKELLCQAVDTDFDALRKPDIVVFQSDFEPNQTKVFKITTGEKHTYSKEQFRAFGRFVRERFDDFAWENDRIAHRTYGKALETWEGEPLSSSTIDIWSKRTPRMVINDWYLADNYHEDQGEGADLYSAGLTRGCGGNGLWAADQLWVSRTFVESRVLANGPLRVVFELIYEPFEVDGISVSEVKRVTLDAGQQLDHFESFYTPYVRPGKAAELVSGIGLKKVAGEEIKESRELGWLAKWEKVAKNGGYQGLAIIVDPREFAGKTEDKLNHLMLADVGNDQAVSYWAGFCWDRAGKITDFESWINYVETFAQGLASPIKVSVETKE